MSLPLPSSKENRRIDSWKEIAAFFGRDERTAKRWERDRGLPVHRLPGERGGVFAWTDELTEWLNSSTAGNGEGDSDPSVDAAAVIEAAHPPKPLRTARMWGAVAVLLAVSASIITIVVLNGYRRRESAPGVRSAGVHHHVPSPEAEQLYLRGRYYWSRRTADSLREAIDAYTESILHDPSYAAAYAGLAECYDLMPEYGSTPSSEAFPRAIAAGRKAISLDDSLGEAHRALGFALFYGEWQVPAALSEYRRALDLDPQDEEAHHWYATSLLSLGRMQEARAEIDQAQYLNPASRSILCDQALIHFFTGEREQAIARLLEIENSEPDFVAAPRYLAYAAFTQKDYRTFIAQSRIFARLTKSEELLAVANAAEAGLRQGGERRLLEAMRKVQERYFDNGKSSGFELARTCALLGRDQDAVTALKGAIAAHDYAVLQVASDPTFSRLSNDPGFQDLVRQITERAYRA